MEEKNIIDLIGEAEKKALAILQQAQDEAAAIVTEAEKRAMEIAKSTEAKCAARTYEILENAKREGEEAYQRALSVCKNDAKNYADELLEHVEPQVISVVGRITK